MDASQMKGRNMAKQKPARVLPDMSKHRSANMPNGVHYLDGKAKTSLIARMRKAFAKVKFKQHA